MRFRGYRRRVLADCLFLIDESCGAWARTSERGRTTVVLLCDSSCAVSYLLFFLRCDAMRRAVSRYRPVAVLAGVDEGSE